MSTWLDRLRGNGDSPQIATYKALRAAGRSWLPKVTQHPAATGFSIVKAARQLGLPVDGNTVVFDDEADMVVLTDFSLFDYRPAGKSLVESCVFPAGELTHDEIDLHQANLASRTSLFAVVAVHDRAPKLLLRDRLNQQQPELWLTDLALSDSFRRIGGSAFLFTRVVSSRGVTLTGGFSFVFDPRHESALVDGYGRQLWSVPAQKQAGRRTSYFFHLNRKLGQPQAYADVNAADSGR